MQALWPGSRRRLASQQLSHSAEREIHLNAYGIVMRNQTEFEEICQFVKDKPAAIMKEAADALAGTRLSEQHKSEGCPSDNMKATGGCCG